MPSPGSELGLSLEAGEAAVEVAQELREHVERAVTDDNSASSNHA